MQLRHLQSLMGSQLQEESHQGQVKSSQAKQLQDKLQAACKEATADRDDVLDLLDADSFATGACEPSQEAGQEDHPVTAARKALLKQILVALHHVNSQVRKASRDRISRFNVLLPREVEQTPDVDDDTVSLHDHVCCIFDVTGQVGQAAASVASDPDKTPSPPRRQSSQPARRGQRVRKARKKRSPNIIQRGRIQKQQRSRVAKQPLPQPSFKLYFGTVERLRYKDPQRSHARSTSYLNANRLPIQHANGEMMVRWLKELQPDLAGSQRPLRHEHSATWVITDPDKPARHETQPRKAMRAFHAELFQDDERLSEHVGLRKGLVNKVDMYHDMEHGCLLLEPEHERLCFDVLEQSNCKGEVSISQEAAQRCKVPQRKSRTKQ